MTDPSFPARTLPCPICALPLKWIVVRWLASFECERCGQFPDFGGGLSDDKVGSAPTSSAARNVRVSRCDWPVRTNPK